jgi:hypothetical protein
LFVGCNLLSTREPENPDSGRTSFQPPTSANIVISNLSNSIKEKNVDNYISCLSDSSISFDTPFAFIPSAEANARFAAVFQSWSLASERAAFINITSNIQKNENPLLELTNSRFDVMLPDSAIYVSDYTLKIKFNPDTSLSKYSGTLQFVILRRSNGLLHIGKWYDQSIQNDTLGNTWSILKAVYSH